MYSAAMRGDTETIIALVSGGKEEWRKSFGSHALGIAAWKGFVEMAYSLCSEGVNVNYQDNEGRTALMVAAYWGRLEIIRCLINYEARADLRDHNGRTAYDFAKRSPETYEDVAVLLRLAAAQPEAENDPPSDRHL